MFDKMLKWYSVSEKERGYTRPRRQGRNSKHVLENVQLNGRRPTPKEDIANKAAIISKEIILALPG
jgi:hypothetical protein